MGDRMTAFSFLALGVMLSVFGLTLAAGLLYVVDRRSLQRADAAAFARGLRILSVDSDLRLRASRPAGVIRTAEGEGKWLADGLFVFWSRANYRQTSQFKWIGRATVQPHGVRFEVRAIRSTVLGYVAALLFGIFFLTVAASLDAWGAAIAMAMAGFILWTVWWPFSREREIAARVVNQLRIRLEHIDDEQSRRS